MELLAYVQQESLISISGIREHCFEEMMFNLTLGRCVSGSLVSDSRSPVNRGFGKSLEVRENTVKAAFSLQPLVYVKGLNIAQGNGYAED